MLTHVIRRLSTSPSDGGYTLIRTAQGSVGADGVYTDGESVSTPLDAVIQPSSGRNLNVAADGLMSMSVVAVMTTQQLLTENEQHKSDRIIYRGDTYVVAKVDGPIWFRGSAHYEAYATKQGAP